MKNAWLENSKYFVKSIGKNPIVFVNIAMDILLSYSLLSVLTLFFFLSLPHEQKRKKNRYDIYIRKHILWILSNNNCTSLSMSVSILLMGDQSKPTVETLMNNIPIIDENRFAELAIRHLVRKLDRRLIPFLFLLEAGSYLNRISIGN